MNRWGLRQSSSWLPIWKLIFMHQFNQSRCQSGKNGEKSSKADFVSINNWMWFAVWHWQWKMWNSFSTHVGERAEAPRFCLMSFIIELLHITHDDILDSIDYVGSFLRMYELINLSCDGFGRGETNRHEHSNGASMPFFFSPHHAD